MKAIVHRIGPDGKDRLGTGLHAGRVSGEHKTLKTILSWVRKSPPGEYHVEVFNSGERMYGTPDIDMKVSVIERTSR